MARTRYTKAHNIGQPQMHTCRDSAGLNQAHFGIAQPHTSEKEKEIVGYLNPVGQL